MLEAHAQDITRLDALIEDPWTPLYHAILKQRYAA
jgi:hypothetical protein